MGGQAQHDQVCVCATQDVLGLRVVVWGSPLPPDVVHDLVLTLARNVGVGQHDLQVLPSRVIVQTVVHVVLEQTIK